MPRIKSGILGVEAGLESSGSFLAGALRSGAESTIRGRLQDKKQREEREAYAKEKGVDFDPMAELDNVKLIRPEVPFAEKVAPIARKVEDYFSKKANETRSQEDYKKEYKYVNMLGEGIGMILPNVAAALLTRGQSVPSQVGVLTPIVAGVAMEKGSSVQEFERSIAEQRGVEVGALTPEELDQANDAANVYAAVAGPLDSLFPAKLADNILGKKIADSLMKRIVLNAPKEALKSAVTEGSTEGLQRFAQNVISRLQINPNQKLDEGVIDEAIGGAMVGGVLSVPGSLAPGNQQETQTTEAPVEQPGFDAFVGRGGKMDQAINGTDELGKGQYFARDEATAQQFGDVEKVRLNLQESEILKINTQDDFDAFVKEAIKEFPDLEVNEAQTALAKKQGYKAIEGSPQFDELAGINVLDPSVITEPVAPPVVVEPVAPTTETNLNVVPPVIDEKDPEKSKADFQAVVKAMPEEVVAPLIQSLNQPISVDAVNALSEEERSMIGIALNEAKGIAGVDQNLIEQNIVAIEAAGTKIPTRTIVPEAKETVVEKPAKKAEPVKSAPAPVLNTEKKAEPEKAVVEPKKEEKVTSAKPEEIQDVKKDEALEQKKEVAAVKEEKKEEAPVEEVIKPGRETTYKLRYKKLEDVSEKDLEVFKAMAPKVTEKIEAGKKPNKTDYFKDRVAIRKNELKVILKNSKAFKENPVFTMKDGYLEFDSENHKMKILPKAIGISDIKEGETVEILPEEVNSKEGDISVLTKYRVTEERAKEYISREGVREHIEAVAKETNPALRKLLTFHIVKEIINDNGGKSKAFYNNGVITVARDMSESEIREVIKHEIRHMATDLFVDRMGRKKLLDWYDALTRAQKISIFNNEATLKLYENEYKNDKFHLAEEAAIWSLENRVGNDGILGTLKKIIKFIVRAINKVSGMLDTYAKGVNAREIYDDIFTQDNELVPVKKQLYEHYAARQKFDVANKVTVTDIKNDLANAKALQRDAVASILFDDEKWARIVRTTGPENRSFEDYGFLLELKDKINDGKDTFPEIRQATEVLMRYKYDVSLQMGLRRFKLDTDQVVTDKGSISAQKVFQDAWRKVYGTEAPSRLADMVTAKYADLAKYGVKMSFLHGKKYAKEQQTDKDEMQTAALLYVKEFLPMEVRGKMIEKIVKTKNWKQLNTLMHEVEVQSEKFISKEAKAKARLLEKREAVKEAFKARGDRFREAKLQIRVKNAARIKEIRETLREAVKTKNADAKFWREMVIEYVEKNLPKHKRGEYLDAVKNTKSPAKFWKVVESVDKKAQAWERKQLVDSINKVVDNAEKLPVDLQRTIIEITSTIELKKHTKRLLERLRKTKEHLDKQGTDLDMPRRVLNEIGILERTPFEQLSNDQLRALNNLLLQYNTVGRNIMKDRMVLEAKTKADALNALLEGSKNMDVIDPSVKLNPTSRREAGFQGFNKETGKNFLAKMGDKLTDWDLTFLGMDRVFDIFDGGKSYEGVNYKTFKEPIDEKTTEWQNRFDPIRLSFWRMVNEFKMTEENAERIAIHAYMQQRGGKEKLMKDTGYTEKQLEITLDEKENQVYNFMRRELEAIYPELAKTLEENHNEILGYVPNHFPMMTNYAATKPVIEEIVGDHRMKRVAFGSTEERKDNSRQPLKMNAFEVFDSYMSKGTYWITMDKTMTEISQLAGSDKYKDAVGEKGQRIVLNWIDVLGRMGGVADDKTVHWLNGLNNNLSIFMLGLRLTTVIKQPLALLDGAAEIGHYAFDGAREVVKQEWRDFAAQHSAELRNRAGGDPAFVELSHNAVLSKIQDKGMLPIKFMDRYTAGAVWIGSYKKKMDELGLEVDLSKVNQEARKYADLVVRKTQASGNFKDLPPIMVGKHRMYAKMVFKFQTFIMNRWAYIRHDLKENLDKDPKKAARQLAFLITATMLEAGISSVYYNLMHGDEEGEDEDKKWKVAIWATVSSFIQVIPGIGNLIASLKYGATPIPLVELGNKFFDSLNAVVNAKKASTKLKHGMRAIIYTVGVGLGLPLAQAQQLVEHWLFPSNKGGGSSGGPRF